MENVYGFTTTVEDTYLDRVVAEVSPETNFVVTTERNTVADEGNNITTVVARKTALLAAASVIPFDTLCGEPLIELCFQALVTDVEELEKGNSLEPFVLFKGQGNDAEVAQRVETVRHEIRRISNVLSGRVIRVTVESF